ncbi:L-rhamnose 1-dehydrogenase (NADP(+)) [Metallosphaera sp. J1]|uniref:beta-ketoacyl-ACP reductase n=1 Tax=Metallosphaera TaxID=41980 RepID=UPI001EDD773F|nr:beta-ketoacyl-ACP reductase [Metallosphaera javensis (ex Hofmann et al. 2022)]MCG3109339.1 L-rhamnose 1-dehydrogenase (NADP(+)) [Metallosphaera javensis (ex Hofmann et al. 2022)]BCS93268.1 MAG: beta-ketoacyl-ACP reductase [Metallosphaera javensis (ex Sakai et al. 2022)]
MGVQHVNSLALVTGGASGIGYAISQKLAERGFNVAIGDLKNYEESAENLKKLGLPVVGLPLDVTSWDSCAQFVEASLSHFRTDHVDVLVNNAGIIRDSLFVKMSREDWDLVIRVHLYGAFNMTKQVVESMISKQHGRIVNMSSLSWTGNVGQANYASAKAGLIGFTKTLAKELGRYNITVNAIAPGFIDTPMTRSVPDKIREKFMERLAIRRIGDPVDVANLVAFLASDEASYITGEVIGVTGGLTF